MVAYKKPQKWKKEESERLRGEREIRSGLLILDLILVNRLAVLAHGTW